MESKEHDATHAWLQEQIASGIHPVDLKDELYARLVKGLAEYFQRKQAERIGRDWFNKNCVFSTNDAGRTDFDVDMSLGRVRVTWFNALSDAGPEGIKSSDKSADYTERKPQD